MDRPVASDTFHVEQLSDVRERVAGLEGRLDYLATREDLGEIKAQLRTLKWMAGSILAAFAIIAASSIAALIQRFLS